MTAKIIPFPKRPAPPPETREEAAAAIQASMKRHPSQCTGSKPSKNF